MRQKMREEARASLVRLGVGDRRCGTRRIDQWAVDTVLENKVAYQKSKYALDIQSHTALEMPYIVHCTLYIVHLYICTFCTLWRRYVVLHRRRFLPRLLSWQACGSTAELLCICSFFCRNTTTSTFSHHIPPTSYLLSPPPIDTPTFPQAPSSCLIPGWSFCSLCLGARLLAENRNGMSPPPLSMAILNLRCRPCPTMMRDARRHLGVAMLSSRRRSHNHQN